MRLALLLVLLAVATGCTPRPEPERAVIRYVALIREGRCDDAIRQGTRATALSGRRIDGG